MTEILKVRSSALSHPGRKRVNNEDFVAYFEPGDLDVLQSSGRLYVVADGVGGASQGERASQYAAEKVLHEFYQYPELELDERLKQAMRHASQEIFEYAEADGGFRRMATTMVAVAILGNQMTVANVGDSRAYLVRDGKARQITIDHTTVGEMVEDGLLSEEEAMNSKAKNRLTRSLGADSDAVIDIFDNIQLYPGDKILLCTDGLTRYALSQDIANLTANGQPDEVTVRLVDFANRRGGVDNISVILIEIGRAGEAGATADQPRGQLPAPVDWDSLVTQPVPARRRKPHGLADLDLRKLALPITLGSIAIFVVALLVAFTIDRWTQGNNLANQRAMLTIQALQASTPNGTATIEIPPALIVSPKITVTTTIPNQVITNTMQTDTSPSPSFTVTATMLPALPEAIPEGSWCVYTVKADGPDIIPDIIRLFSTEGDPENLKNQVYEASSGNPWNIPWPNGLEDSLPEGAQVALEFIFSEKDCISKGGLIKPRPETTPVPLP